MAKGAKSKAPAKKAAVKGKSEMSAEDHRKKAAEFRAHGRMHEAKADLLDAKNPKKPMGPGYY